MNICIVTTAFPRWIGDGRGAFILEAAQAIQRQGHKLCIIAMHNPGSKVHENVGGIEVIRPKYLPERWEILQKDSAGLPQAWKSNPWARLAIFPFFFFFSLSIARWARGYDIIHANWTLSGTAVWLTQCIHRKPFIVTVHGSDIFQASKLPLIGFVTKVTLRKCNKIIAVSEALAEVTRRMGVADKKIIVISNGVNLSRFSNLSNHPREPFILFVGSLIKRKAVDILIQAFSILRNELPQYKLIIVGEGVCHQHLLDLASSLEISDRVTFMGFLSQDSIQEWMRRAMLFVLPSIEEGQGVVLLEALASGTPCVGTRVGGIPSVVTPDVGRLVAPGDPIQLSEAIKEVVCSPGWEDMSRNARKRAENEYDWSNISQRIMEVYRQALGDEG